jgi:hypothetical protein
MAGWLDWLAQAPDPLLFVLAALALAGLYFGFAGLRLVRLVEDVPTARVRSAHQGYVELVGTAQAMAGEPIVAPLSQTPCCWFSYRVERRQGNSWQMVQSGTSDGIFLLRDATGDCVIDPEGAEVTSRHKRSWSGDGSSFGGHPAHARLPSLGRGADLVVKIGGGILEALGSGAGSHRYTERVILEGDPLYAIGQFRTLRHAGHDDLHELTGSILREWKRDPVALQRRFDANGDGRIDTDEWEQARAAARQEALHEQAASDHSEPLHTLVRPPGRRFLLSNLEEFDLVRRSRWRMRLGFLAFLVCAAAALHMLAARL